MPWTKRNFPGAMKNLTAGVRNKAIEIGNSMLAQQTYEDDYIIASAIVGARDWAAQNGKKVYKAKKIRHKRISRVLT